MARLTVTPTTRRLLQRRFGLVALKLCPLCDSLNVKANSECYVCRWSGSFESDPERIELTIHAFLQQDDEDSEAEIRQESLIQKWRKWATNRFRRRIDIQV